VHAPHCGRVRFKLPQQENSFPLYLFPSLFSRAVVYFVSLFFLLRPPTPLSAVLKSCDFCYWVIVRPIVMTAPGTESPAHRGVISPFFIPPSMGRANVLPACTTLLSPRGPRPPVFCPPTFPEYPNRQGPPTFPLPPREATRGPPPRSPWWIMLSLGTWAEVTRRLLVYHPPRFSSPAP